MAELDEVVQKIMLDGDAEVLQKLKEVGSEGYEALKRINEAAESGQPGLNTLADTIGVIAGSISTLASALAGWVEVNTEAVQKTNFLADAFGATTEEINGLEAAFSQAGVSTRQFEQFAQRLTVTIAREWPAITEAVRTSADAQDQANERVRASILRVQEAQQNLALVNQQSQSKIISAGLAEEQSLIKLRFAADEAYSTMVSGLNNVSGANLSLEAAEQRLDTLRGAPPSEAQKQDLQLREAQLAVDKARQGALDALRKQQEEQAEAQLKQQKIEQEAADAALKHETALNEAAVARQKAELAVQEAITARSEAEERAAQVALKSLPQIANVLKSIEDGNKGVAAGFDLSQVSIQNMVKSITLLASEGGKVPPTGFRVMQELTKLLSNDTDHLIDRQQRLAIVQQLSQRGFNATGQAAFELLNAIERGPEYFSKFENAAKKAFATTDEAKENVQEFRDELARLGFAIDLVNRSFAAEAAPVFTEMLKAIRVSLTEDGGLLKTFVDGLKGLGEAFGEVVGWVNTALHAVDKFFHAAEGSTLKVVIIGLIAIVAAFSTSWVAVTAAIALVIEALGYASTHMKELQAWVDKNKGEFIALGIAVAAVVAYFSAAPAIIAAIAAAVVYVYENWDKITAAVGKFIDGLIHNKVTETLKEWYDWLSKILEKFTALFSSGSKGFGGDGAAGAGNSSGQQVSGNEGGAPQGFATGGHVRGPGTATSDNIPAMLSDGEYVVRTAAVKTFGVDFFHALNNLMVPGFASGGLVGAPSRAGTGASAQASRPLNLTIDGQTFSGLRGPKSVVDSLASFAIARQTSSAGTKPSWVR